MSEAFELNIKGLDQLVKALKAKPPVVRIGVLGNTARTDGGNNATIGAVHEFGAPARGIPQRSFLRVPLAENLEKEMEKSGLLDKDTLAAVIQKGSMIPWIKQVAVVGKKVVDDAFEAEGPGWPAWSPGYSNFGGSILNDTGQLRESITTEVDES